MAAVKPMMQQPSGAKPNSSYNNNNGRSAAPSMQQELNIAQVSCGLRPILILFSSFRACQQILKATAEKSTLHKNKSPLLGAAFIMFTFD